MIAIGEAARLSGVRIETIRYYEREGIVPKPQRAPNNRRVYSDQDVGRLRFLKTCRNLGFPLTEAKRLLDLSESKEADCQTVKDLAEVHIANVRKRLAELGRLEAALVELTENCAGGSVACPMLGQLGTVAETFGGA